MDNAPKVSIVLYYPGPLSVIKKMYLGHHSIPPSYYVMDKSLQFFDSNNLTRDKFLLMLFIGHYRRWGLGWSFLMFLNNLHLFLIFFKYNTRLFRTYYYVINHKIMVRDGPYWLKERCISKYYNISITSLLIPKVIPLSFN